VAIVLLGLAARSVGLGSRLSVDEAYTWLVATAPSAHAFTQRLAASENSPPLFYLLVAAMPGTSPAWLRVPAVIPGIALCLVMFALIRTRLGSRAALLGALIVVADPYLITYADLARGFMLADLALLVCLWLLLRLADEPSPAKWACFVVAAIVAVYTEYASAITLAAMIATAVWIGRPNRRATLAAGALAVLAIAPWIPQIVHGQDQVGVTKFAPINATPSLSGLRDLIVTLVAGENGGTASAAGRWLACLVLVAAGAALGLILRRRLARDGPRESEAVVLMLGAAALSLFAFAAAGIAGVHIFSERYLTVLVPLVAGPLAYALLAAGLRVAAAAAVILVAVGAIEVARRFDAQFQTDLTPVARTATALHPRTVLTNTPLVLYYLRPLRPVMDRPYNIGPGRAASCARPCLVVDDTRVPGGTPRTLAANAAPPSPAIGPFRLTLQR
jgi:hypothetical protein